MTKLPSNDAWEFFYPAGSNPEGTLRNPLHKMIFANRRAERQEQVDELVLKMPCDQGSSQRKDSNFD